MSRTINGNLTGKAAQTERREILESLEEKEVLTNREELEIDLSVKNIFLSNLVHFNPDSKKISETKEEIADIEAKLKYGNEWEQDAYRLHELSKFGFNLFNTPHPVDEKHAVDEASDLEYSESYRRFLEANKPKEDAVDYGI